VSPREIEPDAAAIARETVELAFLIAIQQLPPRQRAVLILRDVLGWSAEEVAALLESSVASVKSALQRARATVRDHLPDQRDEWTRDAEPTEEENALLQLYVDAHQNADFDVIAGLLAEDVVLTMPPYPEWLIGRDALVELTRQVYDPRSRHFHGQWRMVQTRANRQPAIANYVQLPSAGETRDLAGEFRAQGVDVLRVSGGLITAITTFEPRFFPLFDLPLVLR
jgi:RNA polymerase sigma-70 factor (ECF subfamily)